MRKRRWIYGACIAAVLLLGMSAAPRYLEELRVGGGYGDTGGGLDIEANGDLRTDGDITAEGRLIAGPGAHVLTTNEGLLDAGALDIPAAPDESVADNADTVLVHDASAGATREMSRQDFLSGVAGTGLWSDAGDYIAPDNAPGVHIEDDGDVVLPGAFEVQTGPVTVGPATGNTYLVKARFEGADTLTLDDRTALEGHIVWSGSSNTMSNVQGIAGRATIAAGYSAVGTDVIGARGLVISGPAFSQINRGIGLKGQVVLSQPGAIAEAMALYGGTVGATGTVSSLYGLYLEDVTSGTAGNYAIYTGLGQCRFGDDVAVVGTLQLDGGTLEAPAGLSVSANNGASPLTVASSNHTVTASQLHQQGEVLVHGDSQPTLWLDRTGSATNGATAGQLTYRGLNSASTPVPYATVTSRMKQTLSGSELGQLDVTVLESGAQSLVLQLDDTGALFPDGASVAGCLRTPAFVTFTTNDTTPSVEGANIFRVPDTWDSGNDVTTLDDGLPGQTVTIIGGDADCLFADNAYLHLAGTWTAHPQDTLVLVYADGVWHELSRSDN